MDATSYSRNLKDDQPGCWASTCARMRFSCSCNSGVNASPKSAAANTWRISTSVPSKGARLSHLIASSRDLHFQSQKPATNSFVSANGPSITDVFPAENFTRTPFDEGWSPSPASITPAFANSSLNLPMSVSSCSLGITPASELLSAFTITMNLIFCVSIDLNFVCVVSVPGAVATESNNCVRENENLLLWK